MNPRSDRIEVIKNVLLFLYWEETINEGYLTLEKLREETDLSIAEVQEAIRALGYERYVDYIYRDRSIGIEEVRITNKGKEKAKQFVNE
jgi:hypothetical protein